MTAPGAFDQVFKDNAFDSVLHTSSPLVFGVEDPEKDILQPAIKGTTEILKSTKEHGSKVKRVIITSSFAALANSSVDSTKHVYSEKDWNPITYEYAVQNPEVAYFASKALAEKAAWDFVEKEKLQFDLVTICPTMVRIWSCSSRGDIAGDPQCHEPPIYQIFNGQNNDLKGNGVWLWVDVRDVAEAHVAALEKPEAGGKRFLLAEGNFNVGQVANYIWEHYPERAKAKGIPRSTQFSGYPPEGVYSADTSASRDILGIKYTKFEDSLKDKFAQFILLRRN
ncbi:Dihydroflavonol-4-reductase [Rhizoctonia solani]|uniref:Dihydroflavonol-4-reductase n=1 Tax=Rhizoctonia solani TaxID=456999 RepID=A0A8H7M2L7_9AGAM|nr:Dihydroflavonol-4-reductase [Rhizoctonia solani]